MKISLVVSDIDGTILLDNEELEYGLSELAALIAERNVPFTFASGRPAFMMEELRKKLGVKLPMVVCNGAAACNQSDYIWDEFLNSRELRASIEMADKMGLAVIVTDGGIEKIYRETAYTRQKKESLGKWDEVYRPETEADWETYRLQKLLIIDPDSPGKVDIIIEKIRQDTKNCQILRYDDRGVEIMPKGCTKGKGVERLAEYLKIPMKEVMVLGDNKNDIDMFQRAGLGAAVGNAVPALKEKADYICESRAVYGVMEAIKKFYTKGE